MSSNFLRICILAATAFFPAMVGAAGSASADTFKLNSQDWKPYQYLTNGQPDGIAVKAVKCVVEKMGHKADINLLPWVRAQKEVAEGTADGFFAASKSAERDAYAELSETFIPQVWGWYSMADKTVDASSKATRVGVLAGSSMEQWLEKNGYTAMQKVQSSEALVKMLQTGRIDAVLANEIAFKEAVASSGAAEGAFKGVEHSNRPLGVYFGKAFLAKNPGFLTAFNGAVKSCQ